MKRLMIGLLSMLVLSLIAACGAAQPETITVVETVVVKEEVEVEKIVEKEVEVVKEVEVEVEKIVEVEVEKIVEVEVENRGIMRYAHDLAWGGTENMDPVDTGRLFPAIALVYDKLATDDGSGSPGPMLAASWEPNEAADVWTFNLREGIEFHDGSPLTSADVKFSVEWWQNETSTIAPVVELIESVETPDDFTVVFNLDQPHADFPFLVMDYRARIVKDGTGPDVIKTEGIGTGPYILEKLDVEGTTVLVSNDDYWGGLPGAAGWEVIGIADAEAQFQALQAGQLDLLDTVLQNAELLAGNDDFNIIDYPVGAWTGIIMNTSVPPFDDVNLRRAMRVFADRQAMVDLAMGGGATVACDTPVSSADQYRFDTDCSPNPELAKELLAEAGYEDGFDFTLHTSDVCADFLPLAEIYQQQAAEVGINLEIVQVPSDGYWVDAWMVEPLVMTCWGQRPADQILNEAYRSGGPWNETYWNREDYDGLLDTARQETDFAARKAAYQAAQELLWLEGGALIPYHNREYRITRKCVFNTPALYSFSLNWTNITKTNDC